MRPFFAFSLRLVACGWLLFFQPGLGGTCSALPAISRHIPPHPASDEKKNKKLFACRSPASAAKTEIQGAELATGHRPLPVRYNAAGLELD
jgi:hypothetical protein